ncbi:hypothetical protein [Rhizobium leguminosarum]|uniref:Uncharacterized protein n=2 Tax=Rhizobium leguminosarum TaxID=384 RepID=A0ABD7PXW0_RHILE|nr:hypothetical protein [Rhizobium leguminosarum]TAV92058.1 hypothetical protein ELI22_23715 [Rhizobium leguminosarum]TAV96666.1 hypothetical protein ELI21_23870 [Rhizobium leguminosarum]TAW32297.1 hypothetical protein ELI19_23505 [Rhizobium leguminosarum]TAW37743.1 hypothetical protein ELI23_23920 [Rhizobium leguminosarum]TAX32571.1 hypothetical protein ELI04_23490 [Rhizobium leguminosarum]
MRNLSTPALTVAMLASCTAVPPFDLATSEQTYGSPVIKIASIMANMKCELYTAANDENPLPLYINDRPLRPRTLPNPKPDQRFSLKNIFSAIEYVGEVELTIDATHTDGLSPSLSFPGLGSDKNPLAIGVEGGVSEIGHRANKTYHSVDFERLVEGTEQRPAARPTIPCAAGSELHGRLGLEDNLKMGIVASSMNDLSVWPGNASNPGAGSSVGNEYTAGRIHAVVDFTTTTRVSGGPNWELTHFVGPNSNSGLFNHKREALNQLTFTFIPICIRDKYRGTKGKEGRWEYSPSLPYGTPAWANYLSPCSKISPQTKSRALSDAHQTNIMSLDNIRLRDF